MVAASTMITLPITVNHPTSKGLLRTASKPTLSVGSSIRKAAASSVAPPKKKVPRRQRSQARNTTATTSTAPTSTIGRLSRTDRPNRLVGPDGAAWAGLTQQSLTAPAPVQPADSTRPSGTPGHRAANSTVVILCNAEGVFHVVFFSPRIPPNTGNAIRLAAGTGCELHLIEPLGFDLSEPKLRRAGLDYHDLASVTVHENLSAAWDSINPERVFAFTAAATTRNTDIAYRDGDVLLFGPEPTGLPEEVLADPRVTDRLRIPMLPGRRSMNLSNAAAVAVYEAWRQQGFPGAV